VRSPRRKKASPAARTSRRKIILYVAVSADGFIARPDGDVAWLDRPRTAGDYGMAAFYKTVDTVLMGRKTYEVGLKFGQKAYAGKKNYVFSRTLRPTVKARVEVVSGDVGELAWKLRSEEGKHIWLVGGAELAAAFLDAGQLDELIIHVIPTLIGEGIPLIQPRHRSVELTLLSTRTYRDGVLRLRYVVRRYRTSASGS
jgi:dihydrofolate reductase